MKTLLAILCVLLASSCQHPEATLSAPMTRLEIHPTQLEIPVGEDRILHVEPFSRDTPLVPIEIEFWVSSGADVVQIGRYKTSFITLRGLMVGPGEVTVIVGETTVVIPITVVDTVSESSWSVDRIVPTKEQRDAALAHRLLGSATANQAPQAVLDELCRWIQTCEKKKRIRG